MFFPLHPVISHDLASPTCPLLLFISLPLAFIGFSESEATWNNPCPKQECWFIREARKLSSCRHSWCLEALSSVSSSVSAEWILFRRQQLYLFSHTKSPEQHLAVIGWSGVLEAILSGTASFCCPASNNSAFPKHTPSPQPSL